MHRNEAVWLFDRLRRVDADLLSPVLNLGSSTREYREVEQPWIHDELIGPLSRRGVRFLHADLKDDDGVDVSGDVFDDAHFDLLKALGAKTVLCCNMLEHVLDPGGLARRCQALVPAGGRIAVTVPRSYPHHRDPIDTLFRPTPEDVTALFDDVEVIEGAVITTGSYRDQICARPWIVFRHVFRAPFPFLGFERWKRSMRKLYWVSHPYLQTCVLLRKRGA